MRNRLLAWCDDWKCIILKLISEVAILVTRTCEVTACETVDVVTPSGVIGSSDVLCVPHQGTVSVLPIDSDDDCCRQVSRWNHFAGVTLQMS